MITNQPVQGFGDALNQSAYESNIRDEVQYLLNDLMSGLFDRAEVEPAIRELLSSFERDLPTRDLQFLSLSGLVESTFGEIESAMELDRRLLKLSRERGNTSSAGVAHLNLSSDFILLGDLKRAEANAFAAMRSLGQGPQVLINLATPMALSSKPSKVATAERIFRHLIQNHPVALSMNLLEGNHTALLQMGILTDFQERITKIKSNLEHGLQLAY